MNWDKEEFLLKKIQLLAKLFQTPTKKKKLLSNKINTKSNLKIYRVPNLLIPYIHELISRQSILNYINSLASESFVFRLIKIIEIPSNVPWNISFLTIPVKIQKRIEYQTYNFNNHKLSIGYFFDWFTKIVWYF